RFFTSWHGFRKGSWTAIPVRNLAMYRIFAFFDRTIPAPCGAGPRSAPLLWGSMLAALFFSVAAPTPASASSRIKDIIDFEGVRDNLLVGYGLVVGLNGTGDDLANAAFTRQ